MREPAELLLAAAQAALRAVDGEARTQAYLAARTPPAPVTVIAAGKAACAMTHGAVRALGEAVTGGLVVTKQPCAPAPGGLDCRTGGHPIADGSSLDAGAAVLRTVAAAPAGGTLLFLISGGASALMEVPPPGIELDELRQVQAWLQGCGWGIEDVNAVRSRLSCIKSGRLARHLGGRRAWNLLLSDVPDDDPATVGSGPLVPAGAAAIPAGLPPRLQRILDRAGLEPPPGAGDPCFDTVETAVIGTLRQAMEAAAAAIRSRGLPVTLHRERVSGDVAQAAGTIAAALAAGPAGAHIWGGETTVTLPEHPGRGGRNQSLCLAVARRLGGGLPYTFLSLGTDGNDGATDDAGGIVDQTTLAAGAREGMHADDFLARADAGTYLEAVGALIHTGATGTNVTDLMIGWHGPF